MAAKYPYELADAMRIMGWIGPRRLVFRGKLVDGRLRSEIAQRVGIGVEEITHSVVGKREAARLLILAGHYHRAGELGLFPFDSRNFTDCLAWAGLPKPQQALPGKTQHIPKVRADAIRAVVVAVERADERGDDSIPLADIKRIVARWMV